MMNTRRELAKASELTTALQMRRDGYSVEYISGVMSIPPMRVHSILRKAVEQLQGDSFKAAAQIREVELLRLDVATKALMPRVEQGDDEAIATMLKVQTRRARYLGLDVQAPPSAAPTRIDINIAWASADRLSYNRPPAPPADVVDVQPKEPASIAWKDTGPR